MTEVKGLSSLSSGARHGVLFVCATPIGNLQDVTLRVLDTLRQVDLIAAEDTRVALKLLNRFGIRKPLISYHQHSSPRRTRYLLERLRAGASIALVCNAGTPGVSDPGVPLVREAPRAHAYRFALATIHGNLGTLRQAAGRPADAEDAYRLALADLERLAADDPAAPEYRFAFAGIRHDLGGLLLTTGQIDEAERLFRDAADGLERLAAAYPHVPAYRYRLACLSRDWGVLCQQAGRPRDAESAYRRALDLLTQLTAEFPDRPDFRTDRDNAQRNLDRLLAQGPAGL